MNKYQRITLILWALLLFMVTWNAPTVQMAIVRGIAVIGATFLLFFAFKSNSTGKASHESESRTEITDVPLTISPDKKECEQTDNVFQGVSVQKFLSTLEQKGVDLKTAKVEVYYKKQNK